MLQVHRTKEHQPELASGLLLETRKLDVVYGQVVALRNAHIKIARGEIVTVLGSNGAGKSSLLKGISRLATAHGSIIFESHELLRLPSHALTRLGIALVPEGRQVFASLTVEENLMVGAHSLPRRNRREAAARVLEMFPLLQERRNQQAGTLSGGQQQILAIGRAAVSRPKLCLIDEPSLGLAPIMVEHVYEELKRLAEQGVTLLIVEQLASVALQVADRGYVLEHGQIRLEGRAADLIRHPEVQRRYLGVAEA